MLDNDITRCQGEGNAGTVCARRLQCQRYLAIAEDVAIDSPTALRTFRNYSAMLCRPPNYPFLWPGYEQ